MLSIALSAVIGLLLGWICWVTARKLTAETTISALAEQVAPVLAGLGGSGVLAVSALRYGGDARAVAIVAILAIPLGVTLLTDLRARLVFPAVLMPGVVAALAIAATLPEGVLPALISGGIAAAVTAVLIVLSRWIWSGSEEPPLGSGDILITAAIGAALGPDDTPRVLFAGIMVAAIAAGGLLLTRRAGRHDAIPYGAFLCASALVGLALRAG